MDEDLSSPIRLPSTFNDPDYSPFSMNFSKFMTCGFMGDGTDSLPPDPKCGWIHTHSHTHSQSPAHHPSVSSGSIPVLEQSVCDEEDMDKSAVNVEDDEITAAIQSTRTLSHSLNIGHIRSDSRSKSATVDEIKMQYDRKRKIKSRKQRKRQSSSN